MRNSGVKITDLVVFTPFMFMSKTNTKYTSQHIDNQSFDEGLQVRVTELIGADGVLKNPATEEKQDEIIASLGGGVRIKKIDEALPYTYIGEANVGTATSAASWRIKRVDDTSDPDSTILYAGTGAFDQVWDNRASLSYN